VRILVVADKINFMNKVMISLLILGIIFSSCTTSVSMEMATATVSPQPLVTAITNQSTAIAVPAADTENEIIFWHPWSGVKANVLAELVEEYNQSNQEGVKVEVAALGDENFLISRVEESIADHLIPDVLAAPSYYLRSLYKDGGLLKDLDEFVNDSKIGISSDEQKTIPASFWSLDVSDGIRYAVPAEYDLHFLFYNQTWAKELGFKNAPANSDEFLNQACAAARFNANDENEENNGTGGWIYNTDAVTMLSWMQVFGGGELPLETDSIVHFDTKADQQALEFLRTIYQLDCAWTGKEARPQRYFAQRYALFYSGDITDWYRQITMDKLIGNTDEWTVIGYPGNNGNPIVNAETISYGILKSTPAREKVAWDFIHWLLSDEVQKRFVEETFSLPINLNIAPKLKDFIKDNPSWQHLLTFLPFATPISSLSNWNLISALFQDIGWQLSLYTVKEADIPSILKNFEDMLSEKLNDER